MFEVGHLLTIGITLILIIFFRLLDKSNRSLDKVRKYVDRCKEDISTYIDDKRSVIKDYGIALEVEKKAAAELMRRIQKLTREELKEKVNALTQIDDRIRGYDTSLTELLQMTGRVQENLDRIREESAFVEGVAKRLGEIKEKVDSAEDDIGSINRELEAVSLRFEKENTDLLKKAAETVVSDTRSSIQALDARLTREEERITELFATAVEKAGGRAEKVEEAALAKLRGQAEDRLGRVKAGFEDNLKSLQELVKTNRDEIQGLIKRDRDEWAAETAAVGDRLDRVKADFEDKLKSARDFVETNRGEIQALLDRDKDEWKVETGEMDERKRLYSADAKRFKEDWEKQAEELVAFMKRQVAETTASIIEQDEELRGEIAKHREEWKTLYNDAGLDIAASVEERIEGYRQAHEERFNQIAGISDDSAQLEQELRLAMESASTRVKDDFARAEREMRDAWEGASSEYKDSLQALRGELSEIEGGLSKIRETAYESMSGKIKTFEDEFLADLSKRGVHTGEQLDAWQEAFSSKLDAITTDAEARRRKAEIKITDDMKKDFSDLSVNLLSNLESLKTHSAAFEEKATREMREANEARRVLAESLEQNLSDAKKTMEEIRRESSAMSKAFERSGALKKELDLHDDSLAGAADRLALLDASVTNFETQFAQMKSLEDDITARITRFTAEKRRIEGMENDFNSLLKTAKSVEEKLAHVSDTDDALQAVQLKIRQLDDAMKDAEEKFQRVERKTQTMQETNDGIDRNFRALQDSEQLINRLDGTVGMLKTDMDTIRKSVEVLSAENEKTLVAAEKLSTLDDSIQWLEERIEEMNKAREMVTRLATELRELDESARLQVRMARGMQKQPSGGRSSAGGKASADDGAPPPRDRDNIIRLRRQGWEIDEIARSMGISRGEVELILELAPKDL